MQREGLAKRLEARFGLGNQPLITRRLYSRLEREVSVFGDGVHAIISETAQTAASKNQPGQWFRRSVVLRLKEYGFLRPGPQPTQQTVENARKVVLDLTAKYGLNEPADVA